MADVKPDLGRVDAHQLEILCVCVCMHCVAMLLIFQVLRRPQDVASPEPTVSWMSGAAGRLNADSSRAYGMRLESAFDLARGRGVLHRKPSDTIFGHRFDSSPALTKLWLEWKCRGQCALAACFQDLDRGAGWKLRVCSWAVCAAGRQLQHRISTRPFEAASAYLLLLSIRGL